MIEPADTAIPYVSVVIPAYNEQDSLAELTSEIVESLSGFSYEIIFVDDGSTDDTWKIITELAGKSSISGLRLITNQGKAAALAAGFAQSKGKFVATLDADLQDDPAEIPRIVDLMEKKKLDLVSGWKKERKDPLGKRIPSKLFNGTVRLVTGVKLHDFNCGLKVYRKAVVNNLNLYGEMHRFTPVLAHQKGFIIGEKVVNHRPRKFGQTKYGAARFFRGFSDFVTVQFLHKYSFRPLHFFGGIGAFLTFIGMVVSAYLTVLWFMGESIGKRPLLLLGVLLIVVGFQFVSLGLLGEMTLRFSNRKPFDISETTDSGHSTK